MKQTISLSLVASASTVVVAAALSLPQAHAQTPNPHPAAAVSPAAAPPAATVAHSPAVPAASAVGNAPPKAPYPPAVPVRAAAPVVAPTTPAAAQPVATSPAASKAAPAPAPSTTTAAASTAGANGPAKLAATPPPVVPALPAPPEELLGFFKGAEGVWRCDGKMPAGAMGPESRETAYKSTVKLKRELGGFWMAGEYEIKKSKLTPGAQARFFIGYEPKSKQFVSAAFDSFGGMDRGGSSGVQGNSLALTGTGTINGTKVQTRSTLTFTTPGKDLDYKFELDRGQGFQLVGEDSCKKGPGAPVVAASAGAAGATDPSKPALAKEPAKAAAEAPKPSK